MDQVKGEVFGLMSHFHWLRLDLEVLDLSEVGNLHEITSIIRDDFSLPRYCFEDRTGSIKDLDRRRALGSALTLRVSSQIGSLIGRLPFSALSTQYLIPGLDTSDSEKLVISMYDRGLARIHPDSPPEFQIPITYRLARLNLD